MLTHRRARTLSLALAFAALGTALVGRAQDAPTDDDGGAAPGGVEGLQGSPPDGSSSEGEPALVAPSLDAADDAASAPASGEGNDAASPLATPELVEPLDDALEEEAAELPARAVLGGTPRHLLGGAFTAWAELGFSGAGRGDVRADFLFSPELGVRFRPDRGLYAAAAFGFSAATTSVAGEVMAAGELMSFRGNPTRTEPGNPTMELGYSGAISDQLRLEVGLGAAIPASARAQVGTDPPTLAERAGSEAAVRAAMAARGYWSLWAWAPERFALYVPVRLAANAGGLLFEGELGLGVLIPILGDRGIDTDVVVQLAGGVGGELTERFALGARVRGVGAPAGSTLSGGAGSDVAFSVEPWARLRLDPVQVTLRASMTLDGPDGLAGDRAPPFGVFAGVGGEVD
ncbi:MAG: hypothetical protein KF729_16810 [Sandaracinaceae bacterium]|nr:hypothetical protein [Sandaracinaceae bacterium]